MGFAAFLAWNEEILRHSRHHMFSLRYLVSFVYTYPTYSFIIIAILVLLSGSSSANSFNHVPPSQPVATAVTKKPGSRSRTTGSSKNAKKVKVSDKLVSSTVSNAGW